MSKFLGENNVTIAVWCDFIGQLIEAAYEQVKPMGGAGEIVQVDETYLHGRRMNNRH